MLGPGDPAVTKMALCHLDPADQWEVETKNTLFLAKYLPAWFLNPSLVTAGALHAADRPLPLGGTQNVEGGKGKTNPTGRGRDRGRLCGRR